MIIYLSTVASEVEITNFIFIYNCICKAVTLKECCGVFLNYQDDFCQFHIVVIVIQNEFYTRSIQYNFCKNSKGLYCVCLSNSCLIRQEPLNSTTQQKEAILCVVFQRAPAETLSQFFLYKCICHIVEFFAKHTH